MHIHILGICGTFMAGVALLARAAGHRVSGSDANVYPPMSTQLQAQDIELWSGYEVQHLQPAPDCVLVGNVMSRGNPVVEYLLNQRIPFMSAPQWLSKYILRDRWVLAVAGTHGKTTTASMLAWILEAAGLEPGFLIGGVPENFGFSARLGSGKYFVIEADEYDTAFFDKRSKFVHYQPRTLILNNLEFDHADIFKDLAAIQTQFHHLLRIVPGNGLIVSNQQEQALHQVINMGCWTPVQYFSVCPDVQEDTEWQAQLLDADGSRFSLRTPSGSVVELNWDLFGQHNVANAVAAMAAASHVGVSVVDAASALNRFKAVKRRMELCGVVGGVHVYDDFAHHPTAIGTTLNGLRARVGADKIHVLLDLRSNTMRMGVHKAQLVQALSQADRVIIYCSDSVSWNPRALMAQFENPVDVLESIDEIVERVVNNVGSGDHILVMSNGAFGGIHQRLLTGLAQLDQQAIPTGR